MKKTIFYNVLSLGCKNNASDWHIHEDKEVIIRYDGELIILENTIFNKEQLVCFFDELDKPSLYEDFKRYFRVDFSFEQEGLGRFRANVFYERSKIAMIFRRVKNKLPSFEKLNLPPILADIAQKPRGIIFLVGVTGSGKSTTMAAMLEYINSNFSRHIITIEDPIEYQFKDNLSVFSQREIGVDSHSFTDALRDALRQDPDVVMVGEMRDEESFRTALRAANTGHLVLSTLHASNVLQAIHRLLDLCAESERERLRRNLAENLVAIVGQRLAPSMNKKGLVPCLEILLNESTVSNLIYTNKLNKIATIIESSNHLGMISFGQSAVKLLKDGIISKKNAEKIVDNPNLIHMALRGIKLNDDRDRILGID